MEKRTLLLSVCFTFVAAACSDTGDSASTSDKAVEMASLHEQEYARMRSAFCPAPPGQEAQGAIPTSGDLSVEPTKIFDNLYFVGNKASSSWALTTPEGIILIDAGFHYSVKETIVDGMEKLGLDPHDIKYVIVSHGHNDHFGGANYLQKTYGARIVMSEADWVHMVTWPQRGSPAPYPDKDIVVNDGDEVTLGGTGKETGDRHPKVGRGVLIGAGAKVLGNVRIGEGATIGAGSVVLDDVPPHVTVAGVPARVIGKSLSDEPALEMDQRLRTRPD